MIVAVSGSTGFIGQVLVRKFRALGWTVRSISREELGKPDRQFREEMIEGTDAVVNMAGAPVATKWTPAYKEEIRSSRVATTRKIATAIRESTKKPAVFISFSAIGIYDSSNTHTEASSAFAGSFLSDVCRAWEEEAAMAGEETRLVVFRTGMVLGGDGGALKKMHLPFSIGLGGKTGSGTQSVSFIHLADLVSAVVFAIENSSVRGVVNAVTPYPSTNAEFSDRLAKVLGQPCWLTIPAFVMKILYGEGAQVMLEGQKVLPGKLEKAGFRFRYPTIQNALVQIYG